MEIIVTIIAAVLMLVAIFGTIFPIIPGSPVAIVTLIAWAWILGSSATWATGIIAAVISLLGMTASLILTGRAVRRERIPNAPVIVATIAAIIGLFVIPFLGLFIGFAVGLFGAEYYRRRNIAEAFRSSIEAMKAMGLGMLIECACAILALGIFGVGVLIHFVG